MLRTLALVTVVLLAHPALAVDGAGKPSTMRGRAAEVFVHRDGKWLHPGWHLDLEASGD